MGVTLASPGPGPAGDILRPGRTQEVDSPVLFPTFTFAAFFAVVLPVSWMLRERVTAWKLFVLAASYYFYGYWDVRFLVLLAGMTLGNEVAAIAIHRSTGAASRKTALTVAVALDLVVLGFFKYYDFFTDSLDRNLGVSSPALDVVLPIGISFFTFQGISYVVDVYRRDTPPAPLLDFAVYLSFFPQLVAGPIVRAVEFLPELRSERVPDQVEAGRAVVLIGRGLFKKVVIADFLGRAIVDDAFGTPGEYGGLDILFGIYGYAIQLYADFSGYTDMAIGIALLLGFRFPQNFDRPYAAVSVQDFWRRWHMTLSRWLRDYLYFPLGGNRKGRLTTYRNLLITMGLGGLWHGAAGTFVVWGLYQGLGMAGERFISDLRGEQDTPLDSRDVRIKEIARLHSRCGGRRLARGPVVAGAVHPARGAVAVARPSRDVPLRLRRLGDLQQRIARREPATCSGPSSTAGPGRPNWSTRWSSWSSPARSPRSTCHRCWPASGRRCSRWFTRSRYLWPSHCGSWWSWPSVPRASPSSSISSSDALRGEGRCAMKHSDPLKRATEVRELGETWDDEQFKEAREKDLRQRTVRLPVGRHRRARRACCSPRCSPPARSSRSPSARSSARPATDSLRWPNASTGWRTSCR